MLNFKLKGSCVIKITDSRTGEVKQVIERENLITNNVLHWVLDWVPRGVFDYFTVYNNGYGSSYVTNIFISADTTTPIATGSPSILATAYTPSGVNKTSFYPNANPIYGQIQQRIDYTGTARTFQTVGLNNSAGTFAYLLLDTPCTQGAYDYLDLFYRVQFINDGGQGLSSDALLDFAKGCFGVGGFDMSWAGIWVGKTPSSSSPFKRYAPSLELQYLVPGYQFTRYMSLGASIDSTHFKWKMNFSANKDQCIGWIFGSFIQCTAGLGGYHTLKEIQNPNAPFQNIFTHSASATVPFFDSLTSAGGNGKIKTSGNWTGKFPELYKITMVTGGATGTATYKYSVRKHLGFSGNSYSDLAMNSPYRIDLPGFHGMKEENNDLLRWSNTQIVQYDSTGVMLLDVYDGSYKIWDSSTTPVLTATTIRQCAVDTVNQKIYVACRTTGLWVIDVANNAIAHPFTNGCYGVDVGRNNVAYALIDGGLYRSSDWSTPLSFTYAGVTDNNWSKVLFLKADREHASDRLCLVTAVPSASNRIVWYEVSTTTATTGAQSSSIKAYPASLNVSDTGSFWASGAGRLTFGSTSLDSLGGSSLTGSYITHSIYGTDYYYKIAFYNQYLILADRIVDINGTTINAYNGLPSSSTILHLDSGITIASNYLRQMFSDNSYCYKHFGWNGSNWELNHNGAKTTHADNQLLGEGINIRFENGTNAPHFISTDFFTQGICWGKWKSNSDTLSHSSCWYSKPVRFSEPVQSGAIVPSAAPYTITLNAASETSFYRIETDSPELHKLLINGVAPATIYTNGTTPGNNEISISGTGVVTFNAAQAGATLSGTYAWIGN